MDFWGLAVSQVGVVEEQNGEAVLGFWNSIMMASVW